MPECERCGDYYQDYYGLADVGLCDRCADIAVARANKKSEWREIEGCNPPEDELPQWPKSQPAK